MVECEMSLACGRQHYEDIETRFICMIHTASCQEQSWMSANLHLLILNNLHPSDTTGQQDRAMMKRRIVTYPAAPATENRDTWTRSLF